MLDQVKHLIRQENYFLHVNSGIPLVTVKDEQAGRNLAKKILYETLSPKTVLYLSGGRTPQSLYTDFSNDESLISGAVALVDERYGESFHENSNELMLRETGFLRYLQMRDISFSGVLKGKNRGETTEEYDQKIRELFATYQKHTAILGVGMDGHTAGIPADPSVWDEFHIKGRSDTEMVIDFDDHGKFYNQRVTMSFLALSMMDTLLILAFGNDKKRPLEWMFADGPEDEVPSRFFKRSDISSKALLITDQEIT